MTNIIMYTMYMFNNNIAMTVLPFIDITCRAETNARDDFSECWRPLGSINRLLLDK